ncbi:hypothetical protein BGZ83_003763 [Gryganskiella cystojenkinii]|nr:hypothetical protein BGZ83_003763 [Gryganskiella cystojenkinii]
MPAPVVVMRRLAESAFALSVICLGLDYYRLASGMTTAQEFFIAVFSADIFGVVLYSIITLAKVDPPKERSRSLMILLRLVFIALSLIAPIWQLKNTVLANKYLELSLVNQNQTLTYPIDSSQRKNTETLALDYRQRITSLEYDDAAVLCWGPLGSKIKFCGYSETVNMCNSAQARTIMILIASLFALIETILYAKSNIGSAEWVQEQMKLRTKAELEGNETVVESDLEIGIVKPE